MDMLDTVIIGAGASGIATGCRLLENNVNNFLVLEAKNRIGGRIHSYEVDGSFLDLGGQWCHGEENNIVYSLTKDLDLLSPSLNSYDEFTIYNPTLNVDRNVVEELFEIASNIENDVESLKSWKNNFGYYFVLRYNAAIRKKFGGDENKMALSKAFCDWYHKYIMCLNACPTWYDMSAKGLAQYEPCKGNYYLHFRNKGYKALFDVLMKKIPESARTLPLEERILLNKTVTTIKWNNLDGVIVNCLDGSSYKAKCVVVTTSLGVLKKMQNTMFEPELPSYKVTTIKALGFGSVNKVFLKFPNRWWLGDSKGINVVWTDRDKTVILEKLSNLDKDEKLWVLDIFGFYPIDSHSNILLVWIVGQHLLTVERLSDNVILQGLTTVLNYYVGYKYNIPKPINVLRSRWLSDPHCYGSYSFRSTHSEEFNVFASDLAKAVCFKNKPVLLFAGEATSDHHYSTVHGAVESGFREADRIINFYKSTIVMSNPNLITIPNAEITSIRMILIWLLNSPRTNLYQRWNDIVNSQSFIKFFKRRIKHKDLDENVSASKDGLLWLNTIFEFYAFNGQFNFNFCQKLLRFHTSVPKSIEILRNDDSIYHQIVIIGAGMAGLGAARTLNQNGYRDVKILEAEEEPGGRLKTIQLENGFVELGAQWIHGKQNNCLYKLAEEYNLLSDVSSEEGCGVYIRDDGFIFDINIVKEVRLEIEKIMVDCEKFVDKLKYPYSFGDFLEEQFRQYLNRTEHSKRESIMKEELFDWHIRFLLVDNSCRTLKDISAKEWGKYIDGAEYVNLKYGYKSLVKVLIQTLTPETLYCLCPVSKINFSHCADNIQIQCLNGKKFRCDHVIVTASLGVLKSLENFFQPSLPNRLQESINSMGFYGIAKIFLIFECKWWKTNGFQLIWRKSTVNNSWTRCITGFDVIYNQPNVLLVWVSGEGVLDMEKLTEYQVGNDCVEVLRKFLNKPIPNPFKVIRSTWMSSPWFKGGYSHITPQCDKNKSGPNSLCDPIIINGVPKIFLAGEACSSSHFSTTHGAFESGQAQAHSLINFLKLC
ncbi:hypothetical protein FQR65_LT12483 [Abscondita terminalis]|nr:hypothetical protein FQR65_LT12483 [Abscondita terminalis]